MLLSGLSALDSQSNTRWLSRSDWVALWTGLSGSESSEYLCDNIAAIIQICHHLLLKAKTLPMVPIPHPHNELKNMEVRILFKPIIQV